jgi:hypothetical protein
VLPTALACARKIPSKQYYSIHQPTRQFFLPHNVGENNRSGGFIVTQGFPQMIHIPQPLPFMPSSFVSNRREAIGERSADYHPSVVDPNQCGQTQIEIMFLCSLLVKVNIKISA